MGEVVAFPASPVADDLSIDLVMSHGQMLGVQLTDHGDIALFVGLDGHPIGGLLTPEQAEDLRTALGVMLGRVASTADLGGAA